MKLTYKNTLHASYVAFITQAIAMNLAPLLFVTFRTQFGISYEAIGLLITLNFVTQMGTDILAARFVDKIGYRVSAVLSHLLVVVRLVSLAVLPFVLPSAFAGLAIAMFIYAVGSGLLEVVVNPIVEALPKDENNTSISLLHSFYCWGVVGVVLLSTLFFALFGTEHWYFLPIIWALVPLFNMIMYAKVPLIPLHKEGEAYGAKKLFKMKLFWVFMVLMVCAGGSELAMSQWASAFAEQGLGVSKTMGDLLGPCFFAATMGVARLLYGKFEKRINMANALLVAAIGCILSYILACSSPYPIFSLIGCGLCGLSVGIMWPGIITLSAIRCPKGGTAMFAFFALGGDVGCTVSPTLVGVLSEELGGNLKLGLLVGAVFPLIMVFAIIALKRIRDKDTE